MLPLFCRVTAFNGQYFRVESPDGPAHLRVLYLLPGQMAGAQVGQRVRLTYTVTARTGLWNVAEILNAEEHP